MIKNLINELLLIWPGLLALILLAAVVMPKPFFKEVIKWIDAAFNFLKLAGVWDQVPPVAKRNPRLFFLVLAILFIICIPFRNYAGFFPQDFTIDVFFDETGISNVLKEFTGEELKQLNLDANWPSSRKTYFNRLDQELKKRGFNFEFGKPDGIILGAGKGNIRAIPIDGWAFQTYSIVEAGGAITLSRNEPPAEPLRLFTFYTLRPSGANQIALNITDIYLMTPLVIMPEFDQSVYLNPTQPYTEHVLIAATKLRFLPIIQLGRTLYLYTQSDGSRIPVGYAIYKPIER